MAPTPKPNVQRFGNLVFYLAIFYFVYSAFFTQETPSTQPASATQSTQQQPEGDSPVAGKAKPGYALRLDNNWPPASDKTAVTAATNLTASNYFLVLDGSGSMSESRCSGNRRKMEVAVEAVSAFARGLPAEAQLGMAVFVGNRMQELQPLGPRDAGAARLGPRLAAIQPAGSTPLLDAIAFAYEKLTAQAQRQLGYGEYHLVMITDGLASKGQDPTPLVGQMLDESPVVLHTIGFCIDQQHSLNQPGRVFYKPADHPEALREGLEGVLAEAPAFALDRFEP